MSNSSIIVAGLSKSYPLRHEVQEKYTALRDVIASAPSRFIKKKVTVEEFWALKDVSFNVEPGERLGIIGRNGAGKSTLLKLLSRITVPTSGSIRIRGRVASLLEVGTGFHPELSGRENIFLNGAILGMTRAEIKKHFDKIGYDRMVSIEIFRPEYWGQDPFEVARKAKAATEEVLGIGKHAAGGSW